MSSIDKLSIQGVRSFGSNAEDCQSISFSSPVTLILGENGCGKTTIIECLKYALTGESPPGSDRGKSFVHDPKIFGQNESLAQIKLRVRNKRGSHVSICRSMKVFSRRGKVTFETLDSTMNFLNDVGGKCENQESISGRCMDIDTAVCDFMGVSKAIINNVLFCHQEDSSWLLDEAKKLKEKFDAIFGITEYNKALDKIIKMRKEANEELKLMEANMRFLLHLKQEMEGKTVSLQQAQQKCNNIKELCDQCDEEIKPIDVRLQEIRNVEYEVGKYQAQKVEMDTKHKNCVEQISNISSKIKTRFEGTLAELDVEIRSFHNKMSEMAFQRTAVEEELAKLKNTNNDLQKTFHAQEKKKFVAQTQLKSEQECKKALVKCVKDLCVELQITVQDDAMDTPASIIGVLHDIEDTLLSKQCEITELSSRNDQAEQERQTKIDQLRIDLTKSEEGILAQEKQKTTCESESSALEIKINQIETSMQQLKILDKKVTETDEIYERTSRNFNKEAIRTLIATKKATITEKEARFKELDEQLTFLSSIAKLMAEINLKEKDLEKKEQEIHRVRSRHSSNFGKLLKDPITSNYRRSMQGVYDNLRTEIKNLTEKSNAEKLKEQTYEIKRNNLKGEIVRLEKELEESEETIFQKCHSTPYDELVERSKAAISKLQFDHGALKSAEAMYKKYIHEISGEPRCPLCHHKMTGDEACDLTSELTDEIQKLPDNINRAEKSLKIEQKKYESLLQISPIISKVEEIKKNLPLKKTELRKIDELLIETANEYETQMALLGEPSHNMELANSMLGDMTLLDEALKDVTRIKKDLDNLKSKLPESYDASISSDSLQTEKGQVLKDLDDERKALEITQQSYEKQMDSLNQLRELKNKLKDQQIKLQEGVQSLPQLNARLEELTRILITIGTEITELKAKIQPLKRELNAAITEKARLKDVERSKLNELNKKFNAFKNADQNIQRLHSEAQNYAKMNLKSVIQEHDIAIEKTKDSLKEVQTQYNATSENLEAIKTDCLNQQSKERDLKDNRELKQLQQKEVDLKENCQVLAKQLGTLDFRSVSKEKNELIKKKDEATDRRSELLGQSREINAQVKKLELEINEPKYKESMQNYRRANFELMVTRKSIEDLGQHRVALEWALIQFHKEKMDKINRLIREYWRMIYRGNDIDYIQIKTDELPSDSSADRRKSYNYRVVQSKNSSEIEMRGRCSAGQRVLASLIIRMALAETFSSNCGVLALDEPTTNLDRINIESLCEALNRIVEERQTQANFMLIIITHDEKFISILGKINSYHRVFRNDDCKSVIRKVVPN